MAEIIDTLLLLALPASGKSEVRRYMASLDEERCRRDFHLGPTVQLDDFPYVHFMRRIDEELAAMGQPTRFFPSQDRPFTDKMEWGTLTALVNEDHQDLLDRRVVSPTSAAEHLFVRIDRAREGLGGEPKLETLPGDVRAELARRLEAEAAQLLADKHAIYPPSLDGRTVVIEFARGGPDGAAMPLTGFYGYQYALPALSDAILERAAILYIWVTPEESRRKNEARADPDDPGSILHHGVPIAVMLEEYGCDDMAYLIEHSDRPGTVRVDTRGRTYHLPVARFDNRVDKTSFIRKPEAAWTEEEVRAIHEGLAAALSELAARR